DGQAKAQQQAREEVRHVISLEGNDRCAASRGPARRYAICSPQPWNSSTNGPGAGTARPYQPAAQGPPLPFVAILAAHAQVQAPPVSIPGKQPDLFGTEVPPAGIERHARGPGGGRRGTEPARRA